MHANLGLLSTLSKCNQNGKKAARDAKEIFQIQVGLWGLSWWALLGWEKDKWCLPWVSTPSSHYQGLLCRTDGKKKILKLSLQIWSACLRLETFLSANSLSEKARLATKYIKSCWIVLSPTEKEKKCPKQLTNSTGAGTWYCNQLLHGNMETRMIAVAQE